jgi:hypothetical protein
LSTATLATPKLTPLQAAAAEYISRRGIRAFMNEDYNLTGTRVRALVTDENVDLAIAFGLPVTPGTELPIAVDKKVIHAAIEGSRRVSNRAELARFFADASNVPSLGFGQRMFLEWHYRSPNNYQFTLEKPLRGTDGAARILGWNRETELPGRGDFQFFTGLLGCTGVCAVAADGSAYMSHWDKVCNPNQFDGYARFASRHTGGRVYVVGVTSRELAKGLRERHPDLEMLYHVKKIYFERTYTVAFSRTNGKVEIKVHEADVADDYVSSTHNGEYGRWFPYGRFGEAYPGTDDEFRVCTFERFE